MCTSNLLRSCAFLEAATSHNVQSTLAVRNFIISRSHNCPKKCFEVTQSLECQELWAASSGATRTVSIMANLFGNNIKSIDKSHLGIEVTTLTA